MSCQSTRKKTTRGHRGGRGRLKVNLPFTKIPYVEKNKARSKSKYYNGYCCFIERGEQYIYRKAKIHWEYLRDIHLNDYNLHIYIHNLRVYKQDVDHYINEVTKFNKFMLTHGIYEAPSPKSPLNEDIEKNARFIIGDLCDYL